MTSKRRVYAARVPAGQRRTELLDAALSLVVTAGHSAVTMEAVAERAGVTKPVVYGVFDNRAALLSALLRREQEQALRQVLEIMPDDLTAPDLLPQLLRDFLDVVAASPDRWRCVVMPMPDLPAQFHAAREAARALTLARAQDFARATFHWLDPEIAAHTMVTLAEMAARLVLTDPAHFRPDRFVEALNALTASRVH
ncbi:DNA-binding transcriptional regulator, AcrR family [Amycolatopsis xylanica]|uniref:DNA-binding transcriptional regulator, AcrR family n=1 Tax=Amycolatopsis xylanica TaxID=589385 RepID=A0A1H2S8T1_9PSEU|nr:TetR/AcrR family transcriptional regulator [Amycolatopsis xylanica]SDW28092.1 DNA-binding transcriptional regulator, AcrR family [Amycolatopsis xylanica]